MADDVGKDPKPPNMATSGRLRPTSMRSTSINAAHVVARSASTTVATASETSYTGMNSSTNITHHLTAIAAARQCGWTLYSTSSNVSSM